jgi:hypothetical protein
MIERRIAWRRIDQSLPQSKSAHMTVTMLSNRSNKITHATVEHLHTLADVLLTTTANFKLVVSVFTGYVYTNDLTLIDQLAKLPGMSNIEYNQAVIGRAKNTVALKNPQHQWRSYLKINKLSIEQKTYLKNFLANQPAVRASPALQQWMDAKLITTHDYFFIDYNETAWLTMLSLVQPGLIRKTLQIVPAK